MVHVPAGHFPPMSNGPDPSKIKRRSDGKFDGYESDESGATLQSSESLGPYEDGDHMVYIDGEAYDPGDTVDHKIIGNTAVRLETTREGFDVYTSDLRSPYGSGEPTGDIQCFGRDESELARQTYDDMVAECEASQPTQGSQYATELGQPIGSDAVRAVGRFNEDGPTGYRIDHESTGVWDEKTYDTREEAMKAVVDFKNTQDARARAESYRSLHNSTATMDVYSQRPASVPDNEYESTQDGARGGVHFAREYADKLPDQEHANRIREAAQTLEDSVGTDDSPGISFIAIRAGYERATGRRTDHNLTNSQQVSSLDRLKRSSIEHGAETVRESIRDKDGRVTNNRIKWQKDATRELEDLNQGCEKNFQAIKNKPGNADQFTPTNAYQTVSTEPQRAICDLLERVENDQHTANYRKAMDAEKALANQPDGALYDQHNESLAQAKRDWERHAAPITDRTLKQMGVDQ